MDPSTFPTSPAPTPQQKPKKKRTSILSRDNELSSGSESDKEKNDEIGQRFSWFERMLDWVLKTTGLYSKTT